MLRRHYPHARLLALLLTTLALLFARDAGAAPEAHILRIDPRAGVTNGKPTLTTVIELVQFKRVSDVLAPCASVTGAATMGCWSSQMEKPGALWDAFATFPTQNAHLFVKVGGDDTLTRLVDATQWGKAQNQPNVGTAWLISVDVASGMGARLNDALVIAHEAIESMQPNDLMDIMFFDDVQIVGDTKWKTFKQRADLATALNGMRTPKPSHGSNRALFSQIKTMTQDAFGSLGNLDAPDTLPLHQAMIVLSNGAGRGDTESASPNADVFHQYLNAGRFPPDNTSLPKTPLPVVSIWFPNPASMTENIYQNNEAQFMQALSNPEIGGYFDIVKEKEGEAKGKAVIALVRARFNAMWLVHWEISCINPSVDQTFNLVFENTHPNITPDGTFKEVPLGIDPTQWPLDVDVKKTVEVAAQNPIYPGGQFTVYGNFCWGGDKTRAEAYFIPAGTKANAQTNSRDPSVAKQAMQQLQAENMVGTAVQTADGYVTFTVPDDAKVLEGTGENSVARFVLYDNKAHRASALDEKSVLTLKATKKPLSWPLIAGFAGLAVVIVLLVMVLVRGGGGKKRGGGGGGGAPPPPPAGYGSPPGYGTPQPPGGYTPPAGGGYGPPPGGGGYGMMPDAPPAPPMAFAPALAGAGAMGGGVPGSIAAATPMMGAQPLFASAPQPMPFQGAPGPPDPPISNTAPVPVIQVRCPACGMTTMASPGQPSVCFSCGQPLPADIAKGGGGGDVPGFPLTGAMTAQPLVPPPNPYGAAPMAQGIPTAATLRGVVGQFTVRAGSEIRVGRDPSQCPILLEEPRISAVHATLKFERGSLLVRDETSNNGTWVSGARIAPGAWTPVPPGMAVRFGPIEFNVQLEA